MPQYIIISPVRNEERHFQRTVDAVAIQTIRPLKWVIVNDGSTDATGKIADAAAKLYPWITVVHRQDRGYRKSGGGVIEAFYEGYAALSTLNSQSSIPDWQFLVKLDGDLGFAKSYFESCFQKFSEEPTLGMGGGMICSSRTGRLAEEYQGDPHFHVRGATKIYRRECWEQIGELVRAPGWDTVDEVKANMLGWKTRTFRDLQVEHFKHAGAADGSWSNWVKNGRANYVTGYDPLFMFLKCVKRLTKKPYGVGSLGLISGFLEGYARQMPRVNDPLLIRYVRKEQRNRLLFRPSIWS